MLFCWFIVYCCWGFCWFILNCCWGFCWFTLSLTSLALKVDWSSLARHASLLRWLLLCSLAVFSASHMVFTAFTSPLGFSQPQNLKVNSHLQFSMFFFFFSFFGFVLTVVFLQILHIALWLWFKDKRASPILLHIGVYIYVVYCRFR